MKTKAYALHFTGAEITLIVASLVQTKKDEARELAHEILARINRMRVDKKCACGIVHEYIPENAKHVVKAGEDENPLSGWYWNCECKSTLFFGESEL
jgi:hypothetical protein